MSLTFAIYIVAALAEIAGCFAAWTWLRGNGSACWLIPGALCLVIFALLLTRTETAFAGRAFAAYGGIYIVASLLWLAIVEGASVSRWDLAGAGLCLAGSALIVLGPRLG